ncbi:FxsA family protein [Sporosarcina ureilytica]|uniref:Membrane protein FxsA n=1 Tax=Sporosarcina ureilytica TaxID=298596 RepID=A0A1D8JEV0_9BACL|nr:FxsA family protein [Sporosarcina ureilytica]AOV07235.1 membrane protein FxsA [Sporosarcina ureilytica]
MKWLVLAFILVPTAELALLIYSGQLLGFFPTISLIILTGFLGAYLAKKQGTKAWMDFNKRLTNMETPGDALIDSVCIFLGGLLLLMPGFMTDVFGFLLLFKGPRNLIRPAIHKWLYKKMKNKQIIIR